MNILGTIIKTILDTVFPTEKEVIVNCAVCDNEIDANYSGICEKCGVYLCDDCIANEYHEC